MDTKESSDCKPADVWCICHLMGHVKLSGKLTEEEKFGSKLGRIDVPDGDGFNTQYFGGSGVYKIEIVSEAVARHVASQHTAAPVSAWDFPKQLTHQIGGSPPMYADDFDDDLPADTFDQ